jgi:uncharacterized protein (TIGR03435 family)
MILNPSSGIWTSFAIAITNHLWQSTLFMMIAGVLTWVLRKNQAQVRYWIWLSASAKFLIPFALLVGLGNRLAKPPSSYAKADSSFTVAIEHASQLFSPSGPPVILPAAPAEYLNFIHLVPMAILAIWFGGFAGIILMWCVRWQRISVVIREAVPLHEERQVKSLRRLEHIAGIRRPIELVLSRASIEPGIFGIRRPVLIWPAGISGRLDTAQLNAILAHEVWHVRRRDNLTAVMHMFVGAVFWFYPLVWWLGARLVEERERACDEEAVRCGSEPQVYADGILNVCKFCAEAPLVCISGVTGGNLKRRMIRIMTQPLANKLTFNRKLLLAGVGIAAIVGPLVLGLVKAPQVHAHSPQSTGMPVPSYEVISIQPNHSGNSSWYFHILPGRFTVTNASTKSIIEYAYNIKDFQLSGGPSWMNSDRYDVDLKEQGLQPFTPNTSNAKLLEQQKGMVRSLLADRFKLKMKLTKMTSEMPFYSLVVAPGGPKIPQKTIAPNDIVHSSMLKQKGKLTMTGVSNMILADALSEQLNCRVIDTTGLHGIYGFTLQWTPGSKTSLNSALQQQLGLRLKRYTAPSAVFVIEHVEKPAEH